MKCFQVVRGVVGASLSLGLVFFSLSCQPKDDFKPRLSANGTPLNSNANQAVIQNLDYNKMIVLTLNRGAEALALVKASLNSSFADSLLIKTTPLSSDFKMNMSRQRAKNDNSTFYHDLNYNVEQKIETVTDDQQNTRVLLKAMKLTADTSARMPEIKSTKSGKKDFVLARSISDEIVLTQLNTNLYQLRLKKFEEVSLARSVMTYLETNLILNFEWNGQPESLESEIKVVFVDIFVRNFGAKTLALQLSDAAPVLNIKIDNCISINGELKLAKKSNDKAAQEFQGSILKINNNQIDIEKEKFSSKPENFSCPNKFISDFSIFI